MYLVWFSVEERGRSTPKFRIENSKTELRKRRQVLPCEYTALQLDQLVQYLQPYIFIMLQGSIDGR